MNKQRDKFLTEAIGFKVLDCSCGGFFVEDKGRPNTYVKGTYYTQPIPDFSTWQGFGQLWEWAMKQEWWLNFLCYRQSDIPHPYILTSAVSPVIFADALYEYLKEKP